MSEEAKNQDKRKPALTIAFAFLFMLVVIAVFVGLRIGDRRQLEAERRAMEERTSQNAEIETARRAADAAKAEAELAKSKLQELESARAAAPSPAIAQARPEDEARLRESAEKLRTENEAKARAKKNPAILALWEEQNRAEITILSTRGTNAAIKHKDAVVTVDFADMPEWLRAIAQKRHREEGEAKGLVREVNGTTYDLRESPGGWVSLPLAEVIQIVDEGYLLIDVRSMGSAYAQSKVFRLRHNGLARVLNTGDRIQVTAMSAGTYSYENKNLEMKTVPMYDPGLPVGPLRNRVVAFKAPRPNKPKGAGPSEEEGKGGSGFFVTEDGLFITNAHVVEDSIKIEVKTAAGKKKATVLRIDKEKDLALLRVALDGGSVAALNVLTNSPLLGAEVFTIGYPLVEVQGARPKFTDGKISSLAGARDDPNDMQISVAVQPGNSGGPLADLNGDIVGVVVARLDDMEVMRAAGVVPQNVNYAVKGTTLARFLRENRALAQGVKFGKSRARPRDEAIQAVEKASGLIVAYE